MTPYHLIFLGLLLSLTPTAGFPDQYITVQIVNDSRYDKRIEVVDNICRLMVLEKRIIAEGMMPANLCARGDMSKGDVTIRNLESDAEKRYQDVREGDRLKTP